MGKIIQIWKARPTLKAEPVGTAVIYIQSECPEVKTVEGQREIYQRDAEELCTALHQALPGGTFDRLLVEMMKLKASSFIVPLNI
jgi:hypothetical protein